MASPVRWDVRKGERVVVLCNHARADCPPCPHCEPHKVHRGRETEYDGDCPCIVDSWCDEVGGGIGAMCRCIPCG